MAGLVGLSPGTHCLVAREQKCRKAPIVVHQAGLLVCTAGNSGHRIFGLSDSKASSPSYFSYAPSGLTTSQLGLSWDRCLKWTELGIAEEGTRKLDRGRTACRQGRYLWQVRNWDTPGCGPCGQGKDWTFRRSWSGLAQAEAAAAAAHRETCFGWR